MAYIIGQILGVLIIIGVIVSLQMKKKWQILAVSVLVNLLSVGNILLLDQFNSAVLVNLLACVQIGFSVWFDHKEKEMPLWSKLIFLVLYLGCGVLGYARPMDLLAIVASVFYMLSVFQKNEQRIRIFLIGNMSAWAVYFIIIGSAALFGQLAGILSSVIGLIRYKKSNRLS